LQKRSSGISSKGFTNVSISDGIKNYSIDGFASVMALQEIANTVEAAAELRKWWGLTITGPRPAEPRWTDHEEKRLVEMMDAGKTAGEISRELTPAQIVVRVVFAYTALVGVMAFLALKWRLGAP
jgi:hypothetical protein